MSRIKNLERCGLTTGFACPRRMREGGNEITVQSGNEGRMMKLPNMVPHLTFLQTSDDDKCVLIDAASLWGKGFPEIIMIDIDSFFRFLEVFFPLLTVRKMLRVCSAFALRFRDCTR